MSSFGVPEIRSVMRTPESVGRVAATGLDAARLGQETMEFLAWAKQALQELREESRHHAREALRFRTDLAMQRQSFEEALSVASDHADALLARVDDGEARVRDARAIARLAVENLQAVEEERDLALNESRLAAQRALRAESVLAAVVSAMEEEFRNLVPGEP